MPDTNTPTNDQVTKIISLDNLETYTAYVERKGIDITYAEYQQLTPAEKQVKTFYITDYPDSVIDASKVDYDNTSSGLESDDVQDAIDELKDLIDQGGGGGTDTTYTLSVGTGSDADKIVLTPSTGTPDKITVPYATKAGDAETVNGNNVPVYFEGTTERWDALTDTQKKSYDRALITNDYDLPDHMEAYEITYNNTQSGLSSTNVQDAIDEVNGKVITSDATTSTHGLMSASDKSKLNGIAPGATANTGTVTSVGITAGAGISVSGSPVTSSGSIAVTNSGVRSISEGNSFGTIKVNTNGSNSEVGLGGVYFASDYDSFPTIWTGTTVHDSSYIEVYLSTRYRGFYPGDTVILYLYDFYANRNSQTEEYELNLSFDGGTTWIPVYYSTGDYITPVSLDEAENVIMKPGKAYTLKYVRDISDQSYFLIDDLFFPSNAFTGTTSEWNNVLHKPLYDIAYITND